MVRGSVKFINLVPSDRPDCRGDIERDDEGEDVFGERRSIIFKTLRMKRIFDVANNTLIYISHARDVQDGLAKMSMSSVPLYNAVD